MLKHKIKELREAAGLNKAQLSRLVGVTDVTVGYWESGAIESIGSGSLLRLGEAFGVSVSELLDDPRKDKPGLEWARDKAPEYLYTDTLVNEINALLEDCV